MPRTGAPVILGGPSRGEICGACDRRIERSRLVMAIPMDPTAVRLHADCYIVWRAVLHRRATASRRSA